MKVLEALSKHISRRIKQSDPHGPVSLEVMEYQLGIWLNTLCALLLTIMLGWACGILPESITALAAFYIVRRYSGGVHMRSLTACTIVSSLLFVLIPFVPLDTSMTLMVTGIAVVLFLLYSPNIFEERNPSAIDPYLKIISCMLVAANFLIQSSEIAWSCAVQAILLLPLWKGGDSE
ncbi:accessory gene regulator ArgB-like protein [Paenibacillus sp. J22TS3]|uniref:accessory gene regulator ArgB-like protein n=1 Tax=Paenibacillus sp. J22TS3 TaxID=2807192 RepID=UPI001B1DF2A9|nr:accessory gene regulator B family protein [Paenibacillus sp. J22TS3]GIP21360.1 hypothetical protein J22TS3_16350 [Paenibacillus sp. J22TS3]